MLPETLPCMLPHLAMRSPCNWLGCHHCLEQQPSRSLGHCLQPQSGCPAFQAQPVALLLELQSYSLHWHLMFQRYSWQWQ